MFYQQGKLHVEQNEKILKVEIKWLKIKDDKLSMKLPFVNTNYSQIQIWTLKITVSLYIYI